MRALSSLAPLRSSPRRAARSKGAAPPLQGMASMADSAEQVMVNVRTLLTDHGVQRGEMFADSAYVFDENTRFDLGRCAATFNTATGAKDGMVGDRGQYSTRQQMLEGYGHVVITTNSGKKLTSPHVGYNQCDQRGLERQRVHHGGTGPDTLRHRLPVRPAADERDGIEEPEGQGSFTLPGTEMMRCLRCARAACVARRRSPGAGSRAAVRPQPIPALRQADIS